MKTISLIFVFALLCNFSHAQSASDEKAVKDVIQKMEDAWNAYDYNYSGNFDIYAEDAVMINPVGMYWKNRSEIIKAHKVFGELIFKNLSTKNEILDLRFLTPTVALVAVKGTGKVEKDYSTPDGQKKYTKGDTDKIMMNILLVKKNNSWKIVSTQVTEVNPMAAKVDPINKTEGS